MTDRTPRRYHDPDAARLNATLCAQVCACGARAEYVYRTVGRVRYVTCRACGRPAKIVP